MNKFYISFLFLISANTLFSQNVFQRKYYLQDTLYYSTVETSPVGNQYINIVALSTPGNVSDEVHFMMLDSVGMVNWYKRHQSSVLTNYRAMDVRTDGHIAVAGSRSAHAMQLLFDAQGNLFSAKNFNAGTSSSISGIVNTPDSHYVMCGGTNIPSGALIAETDFSGNLISAQTFEFNSHPSFFRKVFMLSNNRRLFTGEATVTVNSHYVPQLILALTDAGGNVSFAKQVGDTAVNMWISSVVELPGGEIMAFGQCYNVGSSAIQSFAIKISATGNIQWARRIFTSSYFEIKEAVLVNNSTVSFSGVHTPVTGSEIFICSMDTSGTILSSLKYNDPGNYLTNYDMIRNPDGSFLFSAMVPFTGGFIARYLMKTDPAFAATCNSGILSVQAIPLALYDSSSYTQSIPSIITSNIPLSDFIEVTDTPVELDACDPDEISENIETHYNLTAAFLHDQLDISFVSGSTSEYYLILHDLMGREVCNEEVRATEGTNKFMVHVPGIANGIYILTIAGRTNRVSVKVPRD